MAHPNEALIRRLFEVYRSGDREAAAGLFAEDAVFRYPGPGPLHGDHRGREGIIRFWSEQDRAAGGAFTPELVDLAAGDRHVFLLVQIAPEADQRAWLRVVAYEITDGQISGAQVFEGDPAAADSYFHAGGTA